LGAIKQARAACTSSASDDLNLGVLWEIVTRSQRLAARS